MENIVFNNNDALLIVDVQNDFCPGGALPIEKGDLVVPVINELIQKAMGKTVYASRDLHPRGHLSFAEKGGDWPVHCLQGTYGAAFHKDLLLPENVVLIAKGVRFDKDQYSALDDTGLGARMKEDGITHVITTGLALDVCVKATALDARKQGFDVTLVLEGTKPVTQDGGNAAVAEMKAAGVKIV